MSNRFGSRIEPPPLSSDQMFETTRAIEDGRRVAAEMQQAARRASRQDMFVD